VPNCGGEAPPGTTIQGAEEDAKAGKKMCKECCEEATVDDYGSINEQVGGSGAERSTEATSYSKR
jgi:hypothetical protein